MTLVLGYMRSGSSLTADIIRCNHGDFYIFEPLHGLIEQSRSISEWDKNKVYVYTS